MRRNMYKESIKRYPIRFREDVGPYITIGGKKYPLDTSKYNSELSSSELINYFDKEYQADEEEKAEKARKADLEKKTKDIISKNKKLISGKSSYEDKFEALFDEYVPRSGKSDSLGAEIIRAVNKIVYRWYNDGDIFFMGYGKETCGEAAKFLIDLYDNTDDHEYLEDFWSLLVDFADEVANNGDYYDPKSFDKYIKDKYNKFIDDLVKFTVDTVIGHPELFTEDTEDMLDTKANDDDFEEPTFDYYIEYPDDLQDYLDNDIITTGDIRDYIVDVIDYGSGLSYEDIDCDSYYSNIYGLSYDDWEEIDGWNNQDSFFDQYIEDLRREYGDPNEYNEDEEDEE